MLQLRVFGTPAAMTAVAESLQRIPGARHVIQMGDGQLGSALVSADLVDDAVDGALAQVRRLGVPTEDIVLVSSSQSVRRSPSAPWRASSGPTS